MFAGFYSFRPQALGAKNIVCYDTFFSRARCYMSKQIERSSISSPPLLTAVRQCVTARGHGQWLG